MGLFSILGAAVQSGIAAHQQQQAAPGQQAQGGRKVKRKGVECTPCAAHAAVEDVRKKYALK